MTLPVVPSGRSSRVSERAKPATPLGAPDPTAVMDAHQPEGYEKTLDGGVTFVWGEWCRAHRDFPAWPCELYRLAEALAAEQAKVARAWDEGWEAGGTYVGALEMEGWHEAEPYRQETNPYRATVDQPGGA